MSLIATGDVVLVEYPHGSAHVTVARSVIELFTKRCLAQSPAGHWGSDAHLAALRELERGVVDAIEKVEVERRSDEKEEAAKRAVEVFTGIAVLSIGTSE